MVELVYNEHSRTQSILKKIVVDVVDIVFGFKYMNGTFYVSL